MRFAIVALLFSAVQVASPSMALSPVMTYEKRLLVTTDKRERVKLTLGEITTDMKEVQCALNIAYKESRYNVNSVNKSSGARGVWQLLWGKPEWSLLKQTQEAHKYVLHRYDTWCDAYRFHQERNWY